MLALQYMIMYMGNGRLILVLNSKYTTKYMELVYQQQYGQTKQEKGTLKLYQQSRVGMETIKK